MTLPTPGQSDVVLDYAPAPQASTKRVLRIVMQTIVSAGLLIVLAWLAVRYDVWTYLRDIDRLDVALAGGMIIIACAINTLRWRLLLTNAGVARPMSELFALYLVGVFFSMFLPTGTGGDVVRVYDIARKTGKLAAAVVATLQERLMGLGVSMLIGLCASIYYFERLPPPLRPWVLAAQVAGPAGVALLLYPMVFVRPFVAVWGRAPRAIVKHKFVARISAMVKSLTAVPPLSPLRLAAVVAVSAAGIVTTIAVYWLLGRSLNVGVGLGGFLLVVPLVWVIKMVPVSLGGLGVGEGALFFLLAAIFHVEQGPATAVALAFLAIQVGAALLGGLVLAYRVTRFRAGGGT